MPLSKQSLQEKPFNRCVACSLRPDSCGGPNIVLLEQPRLGEWLSLLRISLNMTTAELAEQADLSEMSVYRAEHGGNVNLDTLQRIAKVLMPYTGKPLPCPLALQDEFESIKTENNALKEKCEKLASTEQVAAIREEAQRKIEYLKEHVKQQERLLEDRYEFLKRKDELIDRREEEIKQYQKQLADMSAAAKEEKKNKKLLVWLLSLAVVLVIVLLVLIVGALIIDYRNPDRGFFWINQLSSILDFTSP